jgi:Protein of unknown function (DUF1822)
VSRSILNALHLSFYPLLIMDSSSISPASFETSLPTVMWLETHHFAKAKNLSKGYFSETIQRQHYVNSLAFLGFSQWLSQKMPEPASHADDTFMTPSAANFTEGVCQFKVGEFKLCLIARENFLDETVQLPSPAIFKPELAAHFYIALEVCQAEEQIILRGVLRYDQLTQLLRQKEGLSASEGYHAIPLSSFDSEPSHLLSYLRYLDTSAIPLPISVMGNPETSLVTKTKRRKALTDTNAHLKSWLQGLS